MKLKLAFRASLISALLAVPASALPFPPNDAKAIRCAAFLMIASGTIETLEEESGQHVKGNAVFEALKAKYGGKEKELRAQLESKITQDKTAAEKLISGELSNFKAAYAKMLSERNYGVTDILEKHRNLFENRSRRLGCAA